MRPSFVGGFTLIELMLVTALLSILSSIAIPQFANLINKSQIAATIGNLGSIRSAISIYYADNDGEYPTDPNSLVPKYLQGIPPANMPQVGSYSI